MAMVRHSRHHSVGRRLGVARRSTAEIPSLHLASTTQTIPEPGVGCGFQSALARAHWNHPRALREVSSSAATTSLLLPNGHWGRADYWLQLAIVENFAAAGARSSRTRHLRRTSRHRIGNAFGRAHPESADSDPRYLSHPQ